MPDNFDILDTLSVTRLWSGDRAGYRAAIAAMLDRLSESAAPELVHAVAWRCVLGPEATADLGQPVRLAERAEREASHTMSRGVYLVTLGAALYRAGRFDAAIDRLEEAVRLKGGTPHPADSAFLAMAHSRLGHHAEAGRWLDRLRDHQPSVDPIQFWNELEFRLLRDEAEAVVLQDPVFPDDPFSR